MKPSRAKKVHYNPGDNKTLCVTNHGHQVTLTKEEERVTCKICLFHLGLYIPENYDPSTIQKSNAQSRLAILAAKQAVIQRIAIMGVQEDFLQQRQ